VALTQNISNTVHIKLYAPVEYRVTQIMHKYHTTREYALKQIQQTDKNRTALIEHFLRKKPDNSIFDVMINCGKYKPRDVAEIIFNSLEIKKII